MRRTLALWLLLSAAYAATLGLSAFGASDYGGDEPHYLLAAESIVEDGDVDVRDEYAERAYSDFYPYALRRHGRTTEGRLNEPHGIGFPLLIAPAYALAGAKGVELFLAAIAALAVALAYRLALRVAPDPWALGAALASGLSPPFLAYGSAVYPELAAGAALAGAALLALRLRERVARPDAFACFALLGALPWLGTKFVPAGVVIGAVAGRALWRAPRRTLAVGAVELSLFSVALYVAFNEALYGGPTPYTADVPGEGATDAGSVGGYLERSYRLVALFLDREYGLLRWAPLFVLAWVGLWFVWREWRGGLARVIPELQAEELAAAVCASIVGAQLLVATFLVPTMFGFWFPGRHLMPALPLLVPLVAIGLRRAPRLGAILGAIGLIASAWVYVDVRWGNGTLVTSLPDAPWGPLEVVWPRYGGGGVLPYVIAALVALAVAGAFFVDAHVWRRLLRRDRAATAA
jgi:hypothetical protein